MQYVEEPIDPRCRTCNQYTGFDWAGCMGRKEPKGHGVGIKSVSVNAAAAAAAHTWFALLICFLRPANAMMMAI